MQPLSVAALAKAGASVVKIEPPAHRRTVFADIFAGGRALAAVCEPLGPDGPTARWERLASEYDVPVCGVPV